MLDLQTQVSGDVHENLTAYSHNVSFRHSNRFFTEFEDVSMSPIMVDALLWGVESFPCQEGESTFQGSLIRNRPLIPPTMIWAGLTILHRLWPVWVVLLGLSLAFLFRRMALDKPATLSTRLVWVLVTIILGPIGLLAYLAAKRVKRRPQRAT